MKLRNLGKPIPQLISGQEINSLVLAAGIESESASRPLIRTGTPRPYRFETAFDGNIGQFLSEKNPSAVAA